MSCLALRWLGWAEVVVQRCPAAMVVPVWSLAEWLPLHTLVAETMMLQRCMPSEQVPAAFLQLFWTLKKEQNHFPFLLLAHLTLWLP